MSEKSTNGRASGLTPMPMPVTFEQLIELNRPALNAMAEVNGKMFDNIAAINKSWVSFFNRRLKEDLAIPQHLAGCKTVKDMYGVYAEFFQNAVADYQSEFEQMSKLGKSLAEDAAQAVRSSAEEVARTATDKLRSKAA
jgi:hypothetical protein